MKKYRRFAMAAALTALALCLLAAGGCARSVPAPQAAAPSPAPSSNGPQQVSSNSGSGAPDAPAGDSTKPAQTPPHAAPAKAAMGLVTAVRLIDASSGWVGGEGWIARTDDGGKQWKMQLQSNQPIKQLFALDAKHAWAVVQIPAADSRSSPLLRTTDGGDHWETYGSVPGGQFIHFVSPQEGFAGSNRTTDGGKSWQSLAVPDGIAGSAYFHDKDYGWTVTQEKGSLAVKRTVDGGKTWKTVMKRSTVSQVTNTVIRSAGVNDAWVVCVGDSGMSQTSYSLFHTSDGGAAWQTVIAKSTAGAGPAPGFPREYNEGPDNGGSKPGELYVVDAKTAFMGGYCPACDNANTVGWTMDGGKTWTNGDAQFPGFAGGLLGFADARHGWWICTDRSAPSVMYVTADGGKHWQKAHTFDKPKTS